MAFFNAKELPYFERLWSNYVASFLLWSNKMKTFDEMRRDIMEGKPTLRDRVLSLKAGEECSPNCKVKNKQCPKCGRVYAGLLLNYY